MKMIVNIVDREKIKFVDVGIASCAISEPSNRPFMKIYGESKCNAVWLDTGELTMMYDYDPCIRVNARVEIEK